MLVYPRAKRGRLQSRTYTPLEGSGRIARMTTAELLRAWLDLLQSREDVRFAQPPSFDPCDAPDFFPDDAQAIARDVGRLSFEYFVDQAPDVQGSLFLDPSGEPAGLDWMRIDGQDLSSSQLADFYELHGDGLGTGQAGWYWAPKDRPAKIVWSLEDPVVFDSLDGYLQVGARRGFVHGWQWAQPNPLEAISAPRSTPLPELKDALVARGATPEVADALVEWLGGDAALLVPRPRAPKIEAAPEAGPVTLLAYRVDDLPSELVEPFAITEGVRRCLFWATRGGSLPVVDQLFAEIPEPTVAGADAGMALATLVGRVVSESTDAHIAVKAQGSFSFGFHSGDAAIVETWLREHDVTLVPIRELLAKVLVMRVEGASSPDATLQITRAGTDWSSDLPPKGPRIYALDRGDSATEHFILHEPRDGREVRAEVRAADVPPDRVARIELA